MILQSMAIVWLAGCGLGSSPPDVVEDAPEKVEPKKGKKGRKKRGKSDSRLELMHLEHEGVSRSAWLHRPDGYEDRKGDLGLIVVLHGGKKDDGRRLAPAWEAGFDGDYLLLFPNGRPVDGSPAWRGTGRGNGEDLSDVTLIQRMVERVVANERVDAERVFVAGMSNGGLLTQNLLCYRPEIFAAAAVVSQTMPRELQPLCKPSRSIPTVFIAGTADEKVLYGGRPYALGVEETFTFFAEMAGCDLDRRSKKVLPDEAPSDGTTTELHVLEQCKNVSKLALFRIEGGEHHWPWRDGKHSGQAHDFDGAEVLVDFFTSGALP